MPIFAGKQLEDMSIDFDGMFRKLGATATSRKESTRRTCSRKRKETYPLLCLASPLIQSSLRLPADPILVVLVSADLC